MFPATLRSRRAKDLRQAFQTIGRMATQIVASTLNSLSENKIAKVDNVSAYTCDGEGQRVRKLVGENLRFVYGIGGQLITEFSGSSGSLQKEYIYSVNGLLATIEPTAVNANGTRYTTPDHLGSPRVVTNSGATVIRS